MQPPGLLLGCSKTPCKEIPDCPGISAFPGCEDGFDLGEVEPEPEQVTDMNAPLNQGVGVVTVSRADVSCRGNEEPPLIIETERFL